MKPLYGAGKLFATFLVALVLMTSLMQFAGSQQIGSELHINTAAIGSGVKVNSVQLAREGGIGIRIREFPFKYKSPIHSRMSTFDFSISASPASVSVVRGSAPLDIVVSVSPMGGFPRRVDLSLLGLPSDVGIYAFSLLYGIPPFVSTLSIRAFGNAPTGSYTLIIAGAGGGRQRTSSVTLVVQPLGQSQQLSVENVSPPDGERVTSLPITLTVKWPETVEVLKTSTAGYSTSTIRSTQSATSTATTTSYVQTSTTTFTTTPIVTYTTYVSTVQATSTTSLTSTTTSLMTTTSTSPRILQSIMKTLSKNLVLSTAGFWAMVIFIILAFRRIQSKRSVPPPRIVEVHHPAQDLRDLYDRGILTPDEYIAIRSRLEKRQGGPPEAPAKEGKSTVTLDEQMRNAKRLFEEGLIDEGKYEELMRRLKKRSGN